MIQKLVQCIFFHILSPTIPLKPLRLLQQLKGKTVTTEVCPFRSSAGFRFAVDFCAWIRWQITYARSAGIDGGCDCTWSQPIQGQMHPHMLAVAQCPFSSSLRAAKSVLLAGYRDLLVQLISCLCVRCQLVHFFPPFQCHLPDPLFQPSPCLRLLYTNQQVDSLSSGGSFSRLQQLQSYPFC